MADAAGRRALLPVLVLAVLGGCASLPPAPALPPPEPLTVEEIEQVALLLQFEDRREYSAEEFARAVRSPSPTVRRYAALSLARIPSPDGVEALRLLLYDADSAVAASAAFGLGQLGDTASVEVLGRFLDPQSVLEAPTVATEAAGALGKIGTDDARELLSNLLLRGDVAAPMPESEVVAEALLAGWRAGLAPGEAVLRWAHAADPELRWRSLYALSRPPHPEAVAVALAALGDDDPRVRMYALRGLAAQATETAGVDPSLVVQAVVEAAADPEYPVRIEALRVLGTYSRPGAVEALVARLSAAGDHEGVAAAESLGRMGPAAAVAAGPLLAVAFDPEQPPALRGAAAEAVAAVAAGGAARSLASLALDPSWRVRAAVARGLGTLGSEGLPELHTLARDADPRVAAAGVRAAVAAASDAPELVRTLLIESVQAADVIVRTAALEGLRQLADPATLPLILDAFERARADSQANAALAAIDALGALAAAGAGPQRAFFTRFPGSDDPLVRRRVVETFGDAGRAAWGEPLPLEPRRQPDDYLALVERWISPPRRLREVPRASIMTDGGEIVVDLFAADAPLTVANFLQLAAAGYFDGQEWPRVVPGFVVQGGDPRGDTSGNPGYTIRDELNRHRYLAGTMGMAHSGPDTAGSQFFITHAPQPHLDGGYTVFGTMTSGTDVIERLLPGDIIQTIREITDGIEEE